MSKQTKVERGRRALKRAVSDLERAVALLTKSAPLIESYLRNVQRRAERNGRQEPFGSWPDVPLFLDRVEAAQGILSWPIWYEREVLKRDEPNRRSDPE